MCWLGYSYADGNATYSSDKNLNIAINRLTHDFFAKQNTEYNYIYVENYLCKKLRRCGDT